MIDTWLIGSVGSWSGLRAAHRPSYAITGIASRPHSVASIDLDRRRRRKPDLPDQAARLELGQPLGQHVGADPRQVGS